MSKNAHVGTEEMFQFQKMHKDEQSATISIVKISYGVKEIFWTNMLCVFIW